VIIDLHYADNELDILEKVHLIDERVTVKDNVNLNNNEVKYYSLDELKQILDNTKTYKHQRYKDYQICLRTF